MAFCIQAVRCPHCQKDMELYSRPGDVINSRRWYWLCSEHDVLPQESLFNKMHFHFCPGCGGTTIEHQQVRSGYPYKPYPNNRPCRFCHGRGWLRI